MKRLQDIQKAAISEEMDGSKSRGKNGTTNKAESDSDESNEDVGDDGEKTSAGDEASSEGTEEHHSEVKGPSKLSAYLNLFGDFVHNMYVLLFYTFFCFFLAARSDRMTWPY